GDGVHDLFADAELHGRLGEHAVAAPLLRDDDDVEDLERRDVPGLKTTREQLERALGRLELIALVLELLDACDERALVARAVDAQLARAHAHVAAARELRDDDVPAVADALGRDVLVARRDLLDG